MEPIRDADNDSVKSGRDRQRFWGGYRYPLSLADHIRFRQGGIPVDDVSGVSTPSTLKSRFLSVV